MRIAQQMPRPLRSDLARWQWHYCQYPLVVSTPLGPFPPAAVQVTLGRFALKTTETVANTHTNAQANKICFCNGAYPMAPAQLWALSLCGLRENGYRRHNPYYCLSAGTLLLIVVRQFRVGKYGLMKNIARQVTAL